MLLVATSLAHAEPTMDIKISKARGDYWIENPGLENLWQYTITNMSDSGSQYNMIDFTLPAGTNQGIFYAGNTSIGWTIDDPFNPGLDNITLKGLLTPNPANPPSFTFDVYFTGDTFHQDYATATAVGPPDGLTFQLELTDVPGEYPHTLSADIYFDGIVNLLDFAVLAGEWMQEEDWYGPPYSGGGPTMDITANSYIGNHDLDLFHLGDELLIQYTVTNTSGSGTKNNMIDFSLPAGCNQGVYDAVVPSGWSFVINDDNTFFNGNGYVIEPSQDDLFKLFSTDLNIHQDYATATAVGPPDGLTFQPELTDVPGEYERTLSSDITGNGIVDTNDLKQMSDEWLITESWYVP